MYTDRSKFIEEYPYDGEFYTVNDVVSDDGSLLGYDEFSSDGNLLGDDTGDSAEDSGNAAASTASEVTETTILACKCDIQEASKMFNSGALLADYNVYFKLLDDGTTPVRRGHLFRGSVQGMPVSGTVTGLFPTQMGVKATVKEVDVDLDT